MHETPGRHLTLFLPQGEPGKTHTLKIEESPIRASLPRPRGPSLPPRKSSDQSTVDQHRQLALQDSSNTVEMEMAARRSGQKGVTREFSVERDLHHQPPKRKASTYSGMGMVVETGAPPTGPQSTPSTKARPPSKHNRDCITRCDYSVEPLCDSFEG
jgi:hypothetical protein